MIQQLERLRMKHIYYQNPTWSKPRQRPEVANPSCRWEQQQEPYYDRDSTVSKARPLADCVQPSCPLLLRLVCASSACPAGWPKLTWPPRAAHSACVSWQLQPAQARAPRPYRTLRQGCLAVDVLPSPQVPTRRSILLLLPLLPSPFRWPSPGNAVERLRARGVVRFVAWFRRISSRGVVCLRGRSVPSAGRWGRGARGHAARGGRAQARVGGWRRESWRTHGSWWECCRPLGIRLSPVMGFKLG